MKAKLITVLLAGTVIGLMNVPTVAAQGDIAVVVNSTNNTSSVTMGELRKIFSGEKRSWPGGASIKLLVRTAGTHERTALLNLLGMSESDYKKYWTSQITKVRRLPNLLRCLRTACRKKRSLFIPGQLRLWMLRR